MQFFGRAEPLLAQNYSQAARIITLRRLDASLRRPQGKQETWNRC